MFPVCTPSETHTYPFFLSRCSDAGAVITTLNNDGSVFRFSSGYGGHNYTYRVCGSKGQVENVEATQFYDSVWNDPDEFSKPMEN